MVFKKTMKRKRKELCPSPLLEDSPKRTKVQAQRKFAAGSNVNSPVITPIRELECELTSRTNVLPEPVELLPMKRPNTEDFLTFLCFRGTPILPPTLNFFNTASIVDTNGQVHEIKSESSSKNGPIDIAKCSGSSSEKPFIAFGVRKRADPIVISKQMDRKRRHALAIAALRRKYQEQKMAKIRALTISKLSEKTTNRTMVKTNTVSKTETVTKKNTTTLQKTKVIATKHVKVTTQTLRTSMRPKIKPKMCLRSFRGRFVQKELPFRKRAQPDKKVTDEKKVSPKRKEISKAEDKTLQPSSSSSKGKLVKEAAVKATRIKRYAPVIQKKIIVTPVVNSSRVTRSGIIHKIPLATKLNAKRQQIKKRILIAVPSNTIIKSKLRSTTLKKSVISKKKANQRTYKQAKTDSSTVQTKTDENKALDKPVEKKTVDIKPMEKKDTKVENNKTKVKELNSSEGSKKSTKTDFREREVIPKQTHIKPANIDKPETRRKEVKSPEPIKRSARSDVKDSESKPKDIKNNTEKSETKKETKTVNVKKEIIKINENFKKEVKKNISIKKSTRRDSKNITLNPNLEVKKEVVIDKKVERSTEKTKKTVESVKKTVSETNNKPLNKTEDQPVKNNKEDALKNMKSPSKTLNKAEEQPLKSKEDITKNIKVVVTKKSTPVVKKEDIKLTPVVKKEDIKLTPVVKKEDISKKADSEKDPLPKEIKSSSEVHCSKPVLKINETVTKEVIKKKPVQKEEARKEKVTPKFENKKVTQNLDEDKKELPRNEDTALQKRPTRKTKEAAAIYMEILSHKLVNDSKIDDDNVSIDSFPELPNVKKTEQMENELKAQAKTSSVNQKQKNNEKSDEDDEKSLKEIREQSVSRQSQKILKKILDSRKEKVVIKINEKDDKNENPSGSIKKAGDKLKKSTNISEEVIPESNKTEDLIEKLLDKANESLGNKPIKRKSDELNSLVEPNLSDGTTKTKVKKLESVKKDDKVKKFEPEKIVETEISKTAVNITHANEKPENQIQKNVIIIPSVCENTENRKSENNEKPKTKLTNSNNNKEQTDPGESLHVDVVATKEKLTGSPAKSDVPPKKGDAGIVANEKAVSSSESDQSTTSDINLKTLQVKARNKKYSKTKSMKKVADFSDSDEEPLSKLTSKSVVSVEINKSKEIPVKEESKKVTKTAGEIEQPSETKEVKPKRECAKRPQNYLPMLSSSEEDEQFFHGFSQKVDKTEKPLVQHVQSLLKPLISEQKIAPDVATSLKLSEPCIFKPSSIENVPLLEKESVRKVKPIKRACYEENVQHIPPSLDLLGKELGRKGKVNMSNEQIEKWLKDSALAGSSIKKENDAMLKFGIPTETSLEICEPIDTEKLKTALLEPKKDDIESIVDVKPLQKDLKTPKAPVVDRKLIFRKDKKEAAPNVNAFSPENECSIYAFGEDTEEVFSTPFRRPSRRPSSASRSEDESFKHDETFKRGQFRKPPSKPDTTKICKEETDTSNQGDVDDSNHSFNVPQNPFKSNKSMVPPSGNYTKKSVKTPEKMADDDFKYKIPSSPSASSSSSAKLYKRQKKINDFTLNSTPVYVSDFPKLDDYPKLVEAPVFHPTEHEFQDPLEYIERIRHKSEQFGICRIVPPSSFKPECKVSDDMRFTSYNQYVHKMLNRWGPNFKELMAIKKYLATQNITLKHPPWIGGMEIDLPRLYQTVQSLGGLKEVIEKKKWSKVSDCMKIPKSAQDRVTKLDDIYCKYLLPYDTLSPAEREKLFDEVETEWVKRQSKCFLNNGKDVEDVQKDDNEQEDELDDDGADDECVVKGRNMALNAFYRIARNTMSMHFKTAEPLPEEVEQEFWKYVIQRQNHICVHSASIDCGPCGFGFAVSKNSPFARHSWNLKVLTNNSGSILRSLGPLMGVTVPTLHVGMVFSACCWSRDPHGLPWVEYLHTGGSKIWYGVPEAYANAFHSALKNLVPHCCRNKQVWLPSDTAMVPPSLLLENQVSVCRTVQEPGQFVVVFPKAFTSSIATGYVVSESVYFAPVHWLKTARKLFDDLKNSCEQAMFSLDKLIVSVAIDTRSSVEVLRAILPHVQELAKREKDSRQKLRRVMGDKFVQEKIEAPEIRKTKKQRRIAGDDLEFECEVCRMNLFISKVIDVQEEVTYCLDHAVELVETEKLSIEHLKFNFTYGEEDLDGLTSRINETIESKLQKKMPNKYHGTMRKGSHCIVIDCANTEADENLSYFTLPTSRES